MAYQALKACHLTINTKPGSLDSSSLSKSWCKRKKVQGLSKGARYNNNHQAQNTSLSACMLDVTRKGATDKLHGLTARRHTPHARK